MSSNQQPKIDPKTGLKERTCDIESFLKLADVETWGKPKGPNLFTRTYSVVDYTQEQRDQELWLYNRRMLTGVDS